MLPWNLKDQFLTEVGNRGGFVNCHAHFDKAFYITRERLAESMVDMETKWRMSDTIKQASTTAEIKERIERALTIMMSQGVRQTASFIDAYSTVGHKAIDAAREAQMTYKEKINFLTITQPLGGLIDPAEQDLYEAITAKADIAGGLPSKDRPRDDENLEILFNIAKNLNKPLHIHIDQENNPDEHDTEKVITLVKKFGYEGRVVLVHAISLSAQTKTTRENLYHELADLGIAVVVCPSAALSMRQLNDKVSPVHNSIANVPELVLAGVTVGLGVDNIADFYQPFVDGDMWTETRLLMEACRWYDFEKLLEVCTENGQKILAIK